ncbi:hypothetical protein HID58_066907, partial [Brassica napus]
MESSKKHSSSHSSSGDLPANEVISPKIEFEVEEDAKEAYYRAHCGSPPPQQENPIPKRPLRPQDEESVEESCLHLFPREWRYDR